MHVARTAASTARYTQRGLTPEGTHANYQRATSTKPPPYHPCMLSRPSLRREVWYEGHPHVKKRREPH